jgi:hypothetical protein
MNQGKMQGKVHPWAMTANEELFMTKAGLVTK